MTVQAVVPTAMMPTRIAAAINMPRRSLLVSGSVGGVLPLLAVDGSFVPTIQLIVKRNGVRGSRSTHGYCLLYPVGRTTRITRSALSAGGSVSGPL
ncbi:hypothetical protein Mycsm_00121 [Mycobacterium sp. JS623]|nr:hypothetical protein Mycsm_00121 [Mycobacterium sp. JS623]